VIDAVDGDSRPFDVAVIGMAGRFPGARDVESLWALLSEGREGITWFTDDELLANGVEPKVLADPAYVRARPVLEDIEAFDAAFFGLAASEARVLDPQQRLFLEHAWHSLEDAGYDPRRFEGAVGVYAGSAISTYLLRNLAPRVDVAEQYDEITLAVGNSPDSISTRVGYLFDLHGPCYSVQSYGSTSLVAVCAAATALVQGECDMALAGGVAVHLPHMVGYTYRPGGIRSPDGRCRSFDAEGAGTPVGSGLGIVVLRRLEDALADGDNIRAVLRGWAVNNGGSRSAGFMAPGVQGLGDVVTEAIALAGVTSSSISYIEAQGSGTAFGDAIEIAALQHALGPDSSCTIGSVNSNLGHLDHAAGVTGLIKSVMALEHEIIPPSLNFATPNPQLLENSNLEVATSAIPWGRTENARRCGVTSYGIGGTNAHVVLEEAPSRIDRAPALRRHQVLVWSAANPNSLEAMSSNLAEYLTSEGAQRLDDIAFTLQTGRAAFSHRRAIVGSSLGDSVEALRQRPVRTRSDVMADRPVGFLIAGVGEQYLGIAGSIYDTEPAFRERIDASSSILPADVWGHVRLLVGERRGAVGDGPMDLPALMGRGQPIADPAAASLARTEALQPALFVVWCALADTLRGWGIEPAITLGYSLGEYVAAYLAGVISFEDALSLVCFRAELISRLPAGAMMVLGVGEQETSELIAETSLPIDVAGVNSPNMTVVGGPVETLDELRARIDKAIPSRLLETTHAFHSRMLVDASPELTAFVREHVSLRKPRVPYVSNVTGRMVTEDEATDPGYWAEHMCSPVRFVEGASVLLEQRDLVLLEIGPGSSLGAMVRSNPACDANHWSSIVATLPTRSDPRSCDAVLAEAIGHLWLEGVTLDWIAYNRNHGGRRVPLPRYQFTRDRHWIEAARHPDDGAHLRDHESAVDV
jgi:acyl transferase domain-containing protein